MASKVVKAIQERQLQAERDAQFELLVKQVTALAATVEQLVAELKLRGVKLSDPLSQQPPEAPRGKAK